MRVDERCKDCGACCMSVGSPPVTAAELAALPESLRLELAIHHRMIGVDYGPCIWLDLKTKLCSHYKHRPQLCRDFEIGSAECNSFRVEFRVGGQAVAA